MLLIANRSSRSYPIFQLAYDSVHQISEYSFQIQTQIYFPWLQYTQKRLRKYNEVSFLLLTASIVSEKTKSHESENKDLIKLLSKSSFSLIEAVSETVFDINEVRMTIYSQGLNLIKFGVLIAPLFSFFDNTQWKNDQLQIDIFMSLIESTAGSSFDQIGSISN